MRADDMTVGEAYALIGSRRIKVTLLPTPSDVREQRKVRLRFETGVTAGRISDLPSRRIAAPWIPRKPRPTRLSIGDERQHAVSASTVRGVAIVLTGVIGRSDEGSSVKLHTAIGSTELSRDSEVNLLMFPGESDARLEGPLGLDAIGAAPA